MLTEQEVKSKKSGKDSGKSPPRVGGGSGSPPPIPDETPGQPPPRDSDEDFWDLLLAHIEEGNVVPIIGSELLTVEVDGKPKTFYRLVAEELLRTHGVSFAANESRDTSALPCSSDPLVLRHGFEVADAVCAINNLTQKPLDEFHVAINKIVRKYIAEYENKLPKALTSLAAIKPLNLFITTTSDNLLATAINQIRYHGSATTCEIEYAPTLSSDRIRDLPEDWAKEPSAVFYLFGKTSASQYSAIHEEDMLEWIYNLHRAPEAGPVNLLKLVRGKHLLFIGCPINDWMGRFLVRTAISKRLVDRRELYEFMVFDPVSMDEGLKLFFERFSKNTKLRHDRTSGDFVEELLTRWKNSHPESSGRGDAGLPNKINGSLKGAIFISYASEDFEAAKNLYRQLGKLAGDEDIAWLDKKGGLEGGAAWEQSISRAINHDCQLFIPLISKHTQQRNEGVFRQEWELAEKRDSRILGKKFIVPLFIDEEAASVSSQDLLVNERFKSKHINKAFDGILSDSLIEAFTNDIREIRRR